MDEEKKGLEPELESRESEAEFDPTECEEFYNNIEAAIGGESMPEEAKAAEALLAEDIFSGTDGVAFAATESSKEDSSLDDELFFGVDAALSEQIEQEFGKEINLSAAEEQPSDKPAGFWKSIPTWTKVLTGCILAVLISAGLLFGTERGRGLVYKAIVSIMMDWAKKEDEENLTPTPELTVTVAPDHTEDPDQNPDTTPEPTGDQKQDPEAPPEPTGDPNQDPEATLTPTPKPAIKIMDDENIINILLLGVENVHNNKYGRTDAIIVVSVDLNGGPLKMISFQRDLFVSIPGNPDDRLNAAYAFGGGKLIVPTIEQNFGIDIDSYVTVDFDGFEEIIDQLGGLRISLTPVESEYLNTTTYISKPSERNTVAGYQNMTGAQVLGYCRIRKKPTAEGLTDDRGRNYRHRVVLQAIFNKYKEKSLVELLTIGRQCFDYVTVQDNLEDYAVACLQAVVENKMFEIKTMQMPVSKYYTETTISGKDVIVAHPECVDKLQDFIYGD